MVKTVKTKKTPASRLKIGIDLDGVIIDHTKNKILEAKKMGFKITPEQTPGHRLRKIVGEENYQKISKYIYGPGTASSSMMQGADIYLAKLKKLGHQLFLVSRRSAEFQDAAKQWLKQNLKDIFNEETMFFVQTDKQKNDVCQKLGLQFFLDDKVSVLKRLHVSKLFLFDPYQIRFDLNFKGIQPVSSWQAFFECVKSWKFQPLTLRQ